MYTFTLNLLLFWVTFWIEWSRTSLLLLHFFVAPPRKVRALLPAHERFFTDELTPPSTSYFLFCLISWRSGEREHRRRTHTAWTLLKEFTRGKEIYFWEITRIVAKVKISFVDHVGGGYVMDIKIMYIFQLKWAIFYIVVPLADNKSDEMGSPSACISSTISGVLLNGAGSLTLAMPPRSRICGHKKLVWSRDWTVRLQQRHSTCSF